jgi:hypothetical protein
VFRRLEVARREKNIAMPRAFISFGFDHKEKERNLFIGQGKHSDTSREIADWSAKEAMLQNQWEHFAEEKFGRCI